MLPEKDLLKIKEELDNCHNPLFIYDDDADGLCSFVLLYRYKGEGHGIPRKSKAVVSEDLLNRVDEYRPDKIFILDIPNIEQAFIDGIRVPIIQVDHHLGELVESKVKVFNPTRYDKKDDSPTSTICYNVVKENLWVCAAGTIADWHMTEETKQFAKENPELLDPKIKRPEKAIFESKIGKIGTMLNFILKGKMTDIKKCVSALLKVKDPEEILNQTTDSGKTIHERYKKIASEYEHVQKEALTKIAKDKEKLFVFKYKADEFSFTSELSNELTYKYPEKYLIICREKGDEMKCSIRSGTCEVRDKLLNALVGIEGSGGGHSHACGANIKVKDFDTFIEQFKEQI